MYCIERETNNIQYAKIESYFHREMYFLDRETSHGENVLCINLKYLHRKIQLHRQRVIVTKNALWRLFDITLIHNIGECTK